MKLGELAELIGGRVDGDASVEITGLTTLTLAGSSDVSFLTNIRYQHQLAETKAAAVIVGDDQAAVPGLTLVHCKDPYFSFRQAMVKIYGFRRHPFSGVSSQASVSSSAKLGKNVTVAPFAVVCDNVVVGDDTVLYPGVFVGPRCRIGDGCVLYPNVVVYDDCILGNRVTLHAGCAVGVDGFGYSTHKCEDGVVRHDKIPPAGNVVIEDDVELGACCVIQRATIGSSTIGAGTKFADLIGIGH
ncbi:MAG TPA: UDP-3-O-(3-hydroxymyristoyl)glucosamine N-acyltransferase, partial [Phycisphaerae bacterium]|nr:UDP-3-O-(3-hydroxymyristoyl)glucosamine N-acyltransferase [Phycisphaerae bacterium]